MPRGRRRRPSRGCRAASRCGSSSPGYPGRAGPRPREPPAATSSSDRRRRGCGRAPCRSPASGSRPGRRRTAPTRPRSCALRRPAGPAPRSSPRPRPSPPPERRVRAGLREGALSSGSASVPTRAGPHERIDRILTAVKAAFLRGLLAVSAVLRSGTDQRRGGTSGHSARPCGRVRERRQPGDAGLPDRRDLPGEQGRLRRGGDRDGHPGRFVGVDAEDRQGRAGLQGAGDRLRVAGRGARRLRRRVDRPGGRHPGDGAGDQHRLLDADQPRRHQHPERPAAQGGQRRRRIAGRARRVTSPERSLGRASGAGRLEPPRTDSAAEERDRRRLAEFARAAEPDRRPEDDTRRASSCTRPAPR